MADRVLVVEDDARLAGMLSEYLGEAGFDVAIASSGEDALARAGREDYAAVILDLTLPDLDGLDVCRALRAASDTPILMLTARGEATDRVVGLELGADDYLPKPFEPRELLARLRAILRRRPGTARHQLLRFGSVEIDVDAHALRVRGEPRGVTSHQFALLVALARNAGRVLSREFLMEAAKGESLEAFDRSIDVHVSRLRAALGDDPRHPRRIITVRGRGYVFAKLQD
jgi:two-component system, OmpR family, phosphate regulon response regulator OmpR